jgi:hypothetical protein
MKHALLALALVSCSPAHAELPPISEENLQALDGFYIQYTPEVTMYFLLDVCDKSDPTRGRIAYAEDLSIGDKAYGCWIGESQIQFRADLEYSKNHFYDYHFFYNRLRPILNGVKQ